MNRLSPFGDKCVNRSTSIKNWFLNSLFVVTAVWILSLTCSTTANAQAPGNTKPAPCSSTVTSAPTDVAESPIRPSAMGYGTGLLGFRGGFNLITNSVDTLMLKIMTSGATAPTDVAVTEPDQNQTTTQDGPCVALMPAAKPKQ